MWSQSQSQTPAIRISADGPRLQHASLPLARSQPQPHDSSTPPIPMPIPNSAREQVPPPLPPPRHIRELNRGHDPGWQWANGQMRPDHYQHHNTAGDGDSNSRYLEPLHRPELLRIGSDTQRDASGKPLFSHSFPAKPDGRIPLLERPEFREEEGAPRPGLARLQSETQLSLRTLNSAAQQFDRQLLSKLDANSSSSSRPNSSKTPTLPSPRDPSHARRNGSALKPLHVPDYKQGGPDSPHRWPGSSPSALSSTSASGLRSPLFDSGSIDHTISPPYNRLHAADAHEERRQRNSVEHSGFLDPELHMEENGMRDLNLSDRSSVEDHASSSTRKRRAPSPSLDDPRDRVAGSQHQNSHNHNDLYHRRSMQMLNSRVSPPSRLPHPIGPASTASSLAQSNGSHWNMSIASSATSYNSERISPGALSPSGDPDFPRLPTLADLDEQTEAEKRREAWKTEKWEAEKQNTLLLSMNAAGLYACECCLKKPRRFRTLEELRHHESEKQFQCQYCPNRFKNKNEAERHQNSLHLRRYSWSCAALSSGRQAFHKHVTRPETTDICGYCGQEFANNPANWRARNDHLVNEHKFGECNQQKKFFRADHFRQHLKHSHGAASGKWTSQLEAICIKDEPLPTPIRPPTVIPPAAPAHGGGPLGAGAAAGVAAAAPIGSILDDTPQQQQQT